MLGSILPVDASSWAWPIVCVAAIAALYLIARHAITAGLNLEISWEVPKALTGRIAVSKGPVGRERKRPKADHEHRVSSTAAARKSPRC